MRHISCDQRLIRIILELQRATPHVVFFHHAGFFFLEIYFGFFGLHPSITKFFFFVCGCGARSFFLFICRALLKTKNQNMQRRHRCSSNARAETRKLHKELRQTHITPLSTLTNGQLAADFAIEYVRNCNAKKHAHYVKKQKGKEKILVEEKSIVPNGKEQSDKVHENNQNGEKIASCVCEVQKSQTHVVCEDVVAQHATSRQKHKRARLFP